MTLQPFGPGNPFYDAFEQDPTGQRANYFGRVAAQPRTSANQRKFFQNQFEQVQNQYLGRLGQMIQGGGTPTQTLSAFLTDYFAPNGQGAEDFMQGGLGERTGSAANLAPLARWLI